MGNRPRIGIIGCGQIAKIRHVPELAKSEHAELAGFYDFIPEHAETNEEIIRIMIGEGC